MSKYTWRKINALMLILALLLGMTGPVARVGATGTEGTEEETGEIEGDGTEGATAEPTATATVESGESEESTPSPTATDAPTPTPEKVVTITPFAGQWKYFGQKRTFYQDVHFSLPNDETLPENVSVVLDSEEVGMQKFKIVDDRKDEEEKKKIGYQIDPNAALYEIRPYSVPADQVELMTKNNMTSVNRKASEELKSDTENGEQCQIEIKAPEGYLISKSIENETAEWGESITVPLVESKDGEKNKFSYYLASNQADNTRKAIDQTPKTITIYADWTDPNLSSVTGDAGSDVSGVGQIEGDESGKFYYIVLPKQVGDEEEKDGNGDRIVTAEFIKNRVASHYGIVGYGRLESSTAEARKPVDISFSGLLAETDYVIYAYMEDEAGNESPVVVSNTFQTDRIALAGTVEITGTMAIDQTVTAQVKLDSAAPGELSYQWYRVSRKDDEPGLDEEWDETGGAEADDLEAEDDDDAEDDDYELDSIRKFADDGSDVDNVTIVDKDAILIEGATQSTYKITKADIGHRLICQVTAEKYSDYVAGESTTFVPKLIPELTLPVISSAVYSPERKLSSIKLPERWSWVDDTIVPVYGNSGYRARYVPENTTLYRRVVVRIKVPVTKKSLAKKMLTLKKTHAYTGKAIKDNFYLEDGDDELVSGKDYKTAYRNNKKLGKAYLTIRGIGNYKGKIQANYKIVTCSVKSLKYSYSKKKVYTGKAKTAGLVIKNGSVKLKKGRDYTITYKNNIEIGKAAIVIQGKGNYKGKKTLHFQIIPSKPKIVKVTKKKTSFRLKFSKNKKINGYRIFVSPTKSFVKNKTQQYITTGNSFGIYGLTAGTYYVRINGYSSKKGKNYDSSYSKSRKIKIKK